MKLIILKTNKLMVYKTLKVYTEFGEFGSVALFN